MLAALLLLVATSATGSNSPFINRVYEYRPAPGQFINVLPEYEAGDTEADMIRKCEALIADTTGSDNYICLGGWGGYVVFGFDHTIMNVPGVADFEVTGNYFGSTYNGGTTENWYTVKNPTGTFSHDRLQTGSAEPGIIWVMQDANGNGLPDDTWYEIAGSEYPYSRTGYSVTYSRPGAEDANVQGVDADGDTVTVIHNGFHPQPYYPQWITEDTYTLSGTLMPQTIKPGTMTLITMDYGYADNALNGSAENGIRIEWAVDTAGQPAGLTGIDFVKVQTGVCQDGNMMGETSTEVTGARDLHPEATGIKNEELRMRNKKYLRNGQLIIVRDGREYTVLGL